MRENLFQDTIKNYPEKNEETHKIKIYYYNQLECDL